MKKIIGAGIVLNLLICTAAAAAVRDCFYTNVVTKELTSAQKKCLWNVLRNLPINTRTHLYQGLHSHRNEWISPVLLDDVNLQFLERNIRNKRTLNFVLQSLVGFGINSALSSALMPPVMPPVAKVPMSAGINVTQPPNPAPTTPASAPVTVPPNLIDTNTIRYPFRPAPGIPFLAFAPLPAGVTAPYPPLLQWPTRAPSTTPTPMLSKPCTCTSEAPPPSMPPLVLANKPYLPISGTMFGFSHPEGNSVRDDLSSHDVNDDHNFDFSFHHGANSEFGSKKPNYDDESSDYHLHPGYEDDEEAEYLRSREMSRKRNPFDFETKSYKNYLPAKPYNPKIGLSKRNKPLYESYKLKTKKHRPSRAPFRIVIPPLPPRKRRDIFFDDAFKNFDHSAFDFHKVYPVEQPESAQVQFLDLGNRKLVPSLDYRKKLERDLEKYVETYVEQQITQGVIDVTKPKKTVVELKTKQGPPIKTVTTTVSKLIDGDKTLLESIFDFSKSINPVANPGELSGVEEPAPPATHPVSDIGSAENIPDSPVSRAFMSDTFGTFSWNNLFR